MLRRVVGSRIFLSDRIIQTFAKFDRIKPHINVGTIGHIDHGKTTLTSAITKYLATKNKAKYVEYAKIDKAPEQKARGITINTATLQYETDKRHYAHVDCPGHIDYVKNMITGAAKMDAGILVVAASDGPMPQTREHVLLCRQIGVSNIIIFLNKMDLVKESEMVDVIEDELKDLLKKHQYDPTKAVFVRGSALAYIQDINPELGEKKIQQLLNAMDQYIQIPVRPIDKPFMMSIENTYNIAGRGAVASGTIEQGKAKIGDEVQLVGYGCKLKTTITGIQTFNKTLDYGQAGDNVGILVRGLTREQLRRGLVMSKPGTLETHSVIQANIYCLKTEEGGRINSFATGYRPQLYYKTADSAAQIKLPEGVKMALPGESIKITAKLNFPLTLEKGSKFTLREGGKTIAGGVVTEILPQNTQIDFGKVKKGKPAQTTQKPNDPNASNPQQAANKQPTPNDAKTKQQKTQNDKTQQSPKTEKKQEKANIPNKTADKPNTPGKTPSQPDGKPKTDSKTSPNEKKISPPTDDKKAPPNDKKTPPPTDKKTPPSADKKVPPSPVDKKIPPPAADKKVSTPPSAQKKTPPPTEKKTPPPPSTEKKNPPPPSDKKPTSPPPTDKKPTPPPTGKTAPPPPPKTPPKK